MLAAVASLEARQSSPPSHPIQSDIEIQTAIGTPGDAATLMSSVLRGLEPYSEQVFVLSRQVRPEWVPRVQGIQFVRLSDDDALARSTACGDYWVIHAGKVQAYG